jgi:hypothetical protein
MNSDEMVTNQRDQKINVRRKYNSRASNIITTYFYPDIINKKSCDKLSIKIQVNVIVLEENQ